jgi:hypothetical protein
MYGGLFRKLNYCPYPASSYLGSSTRAWRSLAKRYGDKLHLPGGGVCLGGKEAGRDVGSDTTTLQGGAAGKLRTEGFD